MCAGTALNAATHSKCAGTALNDVQAALAELNGIELPKQNSKPFQEIAREYLRAWNSLGFQMHVCNSADCLDAPVTDTAAILDFDPNTIINMVAQRPESPTLRDPEVSLDKLPPRADVNCTGLPRQPSVQL